MSDTKLLELARRAAEAVNGEKLILLARDLVRIRSVYEPEKGNSESEAARFLAGVLKAMGLTVTVEEAAPGRPNLIADWRGTGFTPGRKTLMLEGHLDVVTEGDASAWRHPPFAGVIEDGRLFGRGATDMKGGVAAAVAALEAVMTVAPALPGRVRLGFVADEEGMMLGVKDFIRRGWAEEVDAAIVCEPEENELCLWQKGAMRVRVRFTGRMSHGAMPYAGVNPLPWLAEFIQSLGALEAAEQASVGEHPQLGLPWLTPTVVRAPARGEAQLNVMPGDAELLLDIRTVPGQEHGELFEALGAIAATIRERDPRAEIDVTLLEERPWTETAPEEGVVKALEAACRVLGQEPRYGGVPGATDGTFLHAWAGVPIVTVGPGGRTLPHQRDEWVGLDELAFAARLYAAAIVLYLGDNEAHENSTKRSIMASA